MQVGQTILVTEYLENGDLYKAINSQQGNRYHWYRMQTADSKPLPNSGMARRVALDIARGLHFLHTRKIVHFVSPLHLNSTHWLAQLFQETLGPVIAGKGESECKAKPVGLSDRPTGRLDTISLNASSRSCVVMYVYCI